MAGIILQGRISIWDATYTNSLSIDGTGALKVQAVTIAGTPSVSVSNFPATQPVSGTVNVGNFPVTQPVSGTFWQATQPVSGTFFQATQPVSIAATIAIKGADAAGSPTAGTVLAVQGIAGGTALPVSGTFWQATQPVSGTFWQATQPISAASLPLPTGAAQDSTVSTMSGKLTDDTAATAAASESATSRLSAVAALRLLDTSQAAGSQLVVAKGDQTTGLWVNLKNTSIAVTGTFWQATQPVSGTFWQATQPVSGTFWQATQPVSIAATIAIKGADAAGSPTAGTVLAIQGISGGTAVPVSGTFWQATQPISGTVTANVGTTNGLALDASLTGGTQRTKVTDGTNNAAVKAASTAAAATDPALVVAVSPNNSVAVTGTFWQATQPISAASLPLPTGAAQDATLTGGTQRTKVTDGTNNAAVKAASTAAAATDPALVVAVSPNNSVAVTGTFWQATQPISGSIGLNAGTNYVGKVRQTDGTLDLTLLNSAPGSDTGQVAVPVRVISQLGAGGAGGGTSDPAATSAASESATTRSAVTAALRALDTSQAAGSQLVALKGDQTTGLWVNLKNASIAVTGTFWQATQPISGTVTGNQGTAAALASAWPTKITDGTNTMPTADAVGRALFGKITDGTNTAAVKAASTAAAATDPALVVAISPNNSVAVTGTFFQATQPISGTVTANQGTANATPWNENISQVGGTAIVTSLAGSIGIGGDTADGATDAGKSVKIGGKVTLNTATLPTALTAGQRGPAMIDEYGRLRVVENRAKLVGSYKFEAGRLTVLASAHSSTAGFFWLINPVGSTVVVYVKKLFATAVPTAVTAFASSPRVTVERMTFTGTASGATITPAKRDSNDATNTASIRTASTGLTITAGAIIADFTIPAVLTAVGIAVPVDQWFYDASDEDDYLALRAGEGIVIRQADAGTTSDTRLLLVFGSWEER